MNLKLTVDRFEGENAVLITEDNKKIIWPKEKLPSDSHEGSVLIFLITNNEKDNNLAKGILNEILDTEN